MMGEEGYRQKNGYIGTTLEAVYYPPSYEKVPERMSEFMTRLSVSGKDMEERLSNIAKNHMDFERIHPFADGNGRTGRMILNQQLINESLLPIIIEPTGNYRQAFRRYDLPEKPKKSMLRSFCNMLHF